MLGIPDRVNETRKKPHNRAGKNAQPGIFVESAPQTTRFAFFLRFVCKYNRIEIKCKPWEIFLFF